MGQEKLGGVRGDGVHLSVLSLGFITNCPAILSLTVCGLLLSAVTLWPSVLLHSHSITPRLALSPLTYSSVVIQWPNTAAAASSKQSTLVSCYLSCQSSLACLCHSLCLCVFHCLPLHGKSRCFSSVACKQLQSITCSCSFPPPAACPALDLLSNALLCL